MDREPDPRNFEDAFVDAGGVETHYWQHGPEDGQPIVMIHGGGSGADAWGNYKFAMPLLAEEGFHVYAMDMVGFGQSATPDPDEFTYSNQDRIDQLVDFIDSLDIDRPSLVGNSMGGAASLGVAMQSPEVIDRLVLVGGAGYRRDEDEQRDASDALDVLTSFDGTREKMHDVVNVLSVSDWYDREAMVDHRMENWSREGIPEALAATQELAVTDDMSYPDEAFEEVETETLLVYGRNDPLMGPQIPWAIFNLIPDSSLHILNHCGHWVLVDQVEQSAAIIAKFLKHG